MKRLFTTAIVVFFVILASTVHADESSKRLYFVGLWEGIDENDGSEAQRSITLNRDGTFKIIGQESNIIGCQGRGMVTGTGVLEGGIIIVDELDIICDDSAHGPFTSKAMYKPNKHNGTLIEDVPGFIPMNLHKISNKITRD
ncbi:MAG: hypothetical protein GY699_05185 [Desulfobacteraceae bacterium]|nr:hypothetical protein [Desulfobacteraceae bacterium]